MGRAAFRSESLAMKFRSETRCRGARRDETTVIAALLSYRASPRTSAISRPSRDQHPVPNPNPRSLPGVPPIATPRTRHRRRSHRRREGTSNVWTEPGAVSSSPHIDTSPVHPARRADPSDILKSLYLGLRRPVEETGFPLPPRTRDRAGAGSSTFTANLRPTALRIPTRLAKVGFPFSASIR